MHSITLAGIAVALAMDAFAVAIVTGLTLKSVTGRHLFRLAFHFGIFQAAMYAAGWGVGSAVENVIAASDHWVAFTLLVIVGANIIRGSLKGESDAARETKDPTLGWQLVLLSVATSVDALAVGFSVALIGTSVTFAALAIGFTAAAFTALGMTLGRRIGERWGRRVEVLGGVLLIAIGVKIVWDHVMV